MALLPPRLSILAALLFSYYYVTWIVAASMRCCEAFQLGAASVAVPSVVDPRRAKEKTSSSSSSRIQPRTLSSSPQWSHLWAVVVMDNDDSTTTNNYNNNPNDDSLLQVGIAGAGAVAFATAAILSKNGHDVMLWSPSGKGTALLCRDDDDDDDDDDVHDNTAATLPLIATGALQQQDDDGHEYEFVPRIAHSPQQLVEDNDIIMVCLPANGHKQVFDALAPYLANSGRKRNNKQQQQQQQHVIISSHASLGALYLMQEMDKYRQQQQQSQPHDYDRERIRRQQQQQHDDESAPSSSLSSALPTITAWGTTVCTARRTSGTSVDVKSIRQSVDWCTLPECDSSTALAVCEALFPCTHFSPRDGLLAISLSNLNPQNHLGMALGNISRMDKGEAWYQFQMTTPTIGRFLQDLDKERLNIAAAMGLDVKTIYEHFSLSFHVPINTESISDMCQAIYESGNDVYGPNTPSSRYITEDVPFGLVLTAALGRLVGRPAVLHESGIMICNSMYGCDFVAKNDLLQAVKLDEMSLVDLQRAVRTGSRTRGISSHELLASTASSSLK